MVGGFIEKTLKLNLARNGLRVLLALVIVTDLQEAKVSSSTLEEITGLAKRTISKHTKYLVSLGIIKRDNSVRPTRYCVYTDIEPQVINKRVCVLIKEKEQESMRDKYSVQQYMPITPNKGQQSTDYGYFTKIINKTLNNNISIKNKYIIACLSKFFLLNTFREIEPIPILAKIIGDNYCYFMDKVGLCGKADCKELIKEAWEQSEGAESPLAYFKAVLKSKAVRAREEKVVRREEGNSELRRLGL